MRHHDAPYAAPDEFAERVQLKGIQLSPALIDHGQIVMRIHGHIAMPREMFCGSHDTCILHSPHVLQAVPCHTFFILPEGSVIDDGITRVVVDVDHRCVVHMNAHAPALLRHPSAIVVDDLRILHRAKHHLPGKPRDTVHPHTQAILGIDGHEDGRSGNRLEPVHQRGLFHRCTLEKADAAYVVTAHRILHLTLMESDRTVADGGHSNDHQLADLLLRCQGSENTVDPCILRQAAVALCGQGGH